ncbi:Protein COBRA [Rhynchospora pubera]|uniref:Protein COBRA n=1 Tax=Rhynchospora pubera TaxID=906938 RepID=A0AAV8E8N0_9POAL|nr:Protein COBRA [Rhynchospora pubera]
MAMSPQKHILSLLLLLLLILIQTLALSESLPTTTTNVQRHLLQATSTTPATTTPATTTTPASTTPATTTPSTATPATTTPSTATPSTTTPSTETPTTTDPKVAAPPPPKPDRPDEIDCNGILLTYNVDNMTKIRPFTTDKSVQPFGFGATAALENAYTITLRNYTLLITYQHKEILVSMNGGVLTEDYFLPYNTSEAPFVSFSGYPDADLPTPIATGGDLKKFVHNITLTGTMFGWVNPLPKKMVLGDPHWDCSNMSLYGNFPNFTSTCCVPNPNNLPEEDSISTESIYDPLISTSDYRPRNTGNITISYDVLLTYPGSYLAQVTIENKDMLTRLDGWQLSWKWKRNEFIYQIKGAYTTVTGSSECLFGPQGKYYQGMDFTNVTNCQRNPTMIDLPPWRYNDSDVGRIPFCCRNGTIYPKMVNASAYKAAFQMLVFKMPPDLDRFRLYSPQNFTLTSTNRLSHKYNCSEPLFVNPNEFPDPSGLTTNATAVASWQVTCNITDSPVRKCCVSFSAYYNESVMPCRTCACGCPATSPGPPCSTSEPALLMPQDALLQRYDNRTLKQLQWADKNHFVLPKTLPCGDYCGVNLNWHILNQTRDKEAYDARMTIINWDNTSYVNWYVAVKMNPAYTEFFDSDGYNVTTVGNDTLILMGNVNSSYLLGVTNKTHPGMHQGVLLFNQLMGMNLKGGDGNPVKVYFNGEECTMPEGILDDTPSSGYRTGASRVIHFILGAFFFAFVMIRL